MEETVKLKKAKKTRVIPGFKLTMGITVTMLSLIVLIPLASVMVYSLKLPPSEFIKLITKQNVVYAFTTSIVCSFIAAVINVIFGVILAWTLVKYDFPGKRILDGFIELPFALPTAVAGITLSKMYSDTGILGKPLAAIGIKVSYTHLGIIVALIFIGIPFVVRNVQPVLEKLDGQYEEAARCLEELTSTFQKERFHPICGDNLINAILDSKRQTASQYNIRTSFQLLLSEKMKIETSDLSSIFFNLMDNGIESCQNSHSSDPFIQITASQNANFLTIHMTNSKDPSYKFNHKTNKTDSWAHGFGLAIIEEIASKYDGSCQWIDGGDVFESVVMVEVG